MHTTYIQIGTHYIFVSTQDEQVLDWVGRQFRIVQPERWDDCLPDMYVRIGRGYGSAAQNIQVNIRRERDRIQYGREDFLLETDEHYRRVRLEIHDDLSLNHALMTIYSAFIVHNRWGMMLHSSCVVQNGKGYLFAGPSGAGKSTVAMLSRPRKVLSDEATLVKLEEDGAYVYDSPFRSDSEPTFESEALPLAGIYMLEQATHIQQTRIKPSEAVLRMMDKIFYWAVEPAETVKLLSLSGQLAALVPAYDLSFQKK